MNKIEEFKYIIGRFDHFFDSINNKGNLYLSINTFILGGILVGFATLTEIESFPNWVIYTFLIPALVSNLLSFIATILAIKPFITGWGKKNGTSLLFFLDINKMSKDRWNQSWAGITDDQWSSDLQNQIKIMSEGLTAKFNRLQYATLFIAIQITVIFLFAIYFLIIKQTSIL